MNEIEVPVVRSLVINNFLLPFFLCEKLAMSLVAYYETQTIVRRKHAVCGAFLFNNF